MRSLKLPKWKRYLALRKYCLYYLDFQLVTIFSGILATFSGVFAPYTVKLAIDYAYPNHDMPLVIALSSVGLLLTIFNRLGTGAQQFFQLQASQRIGYSLRSRFMKHVYGLPFSYFQSHTTGENLYRLNFDIPVVAGLTGGFVRTVVSPFISAVFPLVAIFWLDWRFGLVAICAVPLYLLQMGYFALRQRRLSKSIADEAQRVQSEVTERIGQVKLAKCFGTELDEVRLFLRNQIKLIRLAYKDFLLGFGRDVTSDSINGIMQACVSTYLGYRIITGSMTIGSLVALTLYLQQLIGATGSIAGLYHGIMSQIVQVDRLFDILDMGTECNESPDAEDIPTVIGPIDIRNVEFGYSEGQKALQGLNLTVKPGSTVAIVGPSGSGKSTLVALLLRLYEPQKGSISLGGVDIRNVKLRSLRRKIGVVLQESDLLNDTIRANISYAHPEATDTDIVAAARIADVHDFINSLPDGYSSTVGEGGSHLSRGQRQRICIARAVLGHPDLLILDEATASLSPDSEASVLDSLAASNDGRTTIMMTHRLLGAVRADHIFVVSEGCVADEGTHLELMARPGLYRNMWERQSGLDVVNSAGVSGISRESDLLVESAVEL